MYPKWSRSAITRAKSQELCTSYLYKDVLAISGIRKPEILENSCARWPCNSDRKYRTTNCPASSASTRTRSPVTSNCWKKRSSSSPEQFQQEPAQRDPRKPEDLLLRQRHPQCHHPKPEPAFPPQRQGRALGELLVTERMKYREYHRLPANRFFWRTIQQQEIDLIEGNGRTTLRVRVRLES